jgi:Alcohol dehydrogenase GroES-like domain
MRICEYRSGGVETYYGIDGREHACGSRAYPICGYERRRLSVNIAAEWRWGFPVTQMLALRGFEGEKVARAAQVEVPMLGDDDVLVKVRSAGLTAGTFILLEVGALRPLPMTVGHEGAGIVVEVGRDVSEFKAGDRVRIHPTMSCGRCRHCLVGLQQYCDGAALMGFVALGRQPVKEYARNRDGGSIRPRRPLSV